MEKLIEELFKGVIARLEALETNKVPLPQIPTGPGDPNQASEAQRRFVGRIMGHEAPRDLSGMEAGRIIDEFKRKGGFPKIAKGGEIPKPPVEDAEESYMPEAKPLTEAEIEELGEGALM